MQDRDDSRRSLFEREERHLLRQLPQGRFEIKTYLNLTVGSNYHVYIKRYRHYYSVPYRYCHQHCKVICTAMNVMIYLNGEQIAFHFRDYSSNRYTTNPDHMPEKHRYVVGTVS